MITELITSTPFRDRRTVSPHRNYSTAVFFKIVKPLFLLLLLPGLLLSAARAIPVPGATITLNGGQLTNVFSSDDFTVTFTTAQTGLTASNFTVTGTVTGAFVSNVTGSGTSWTVTVTIPGSFQSQGTFTLNLANSSNLSPGLSGLPIAGPPVEVIAYPLDGTFSLSSTNANSGYAKTGDKINFTLQSAHYDVENWGVNIAGQNASGFSNLSNMATGQVTLGSGTAQGALTWSWHYTNTFNESDNGSGTSGIIFDSVNPTISVGAPSVSSITDFTGSVTYNVTYADANFNTSTLSTSNITLNKTGTANGTVGLTENSSTSYTVTISNISGSGTLGISIATGTASDNAGNLAPASGASATFIAVQPTTPTTTSISSSNNPSFSAAPGNSITFTATVTSNTTVNEGTVTFSSNGTPIPGGTGSTVAVSNGQAAFTTNFTAAGSYPILAAYSGTVNFSASSGSLNQQVNLHPTTINSITANSAYSNAGTIQFTVTFGASISGLGATNFSLTTSGVSGASIASVSPASGSTYTVTVNTGAGDGIIGLNLDNATGLTPGISTALPFTGGTTTIDKTPPVVIIGAPSATITNGGPVSFDVSFSDANFNSTTFFTNNVIVNATGTANYTQVTTVQNSATDFTVSVDGTSGDGTLSISVQAGTSQDLAGNTDIGAGPSATFTVDNTAPVLSGLVYSSSNANSNFAKTGDVVTLLFGANEALQTPSVTIAGHSITATNTGGNNYSASYTMTSGDTEGRIPFNLSIADLAGNAGNYNDVAAGDDITFDMTPPTAAISAPSVAGIGTGGAGTVTYTITYADANFSSSNLTNSGITLISAGTASGTVNVTGAGTAYTVTISGITGLGSLGISLAGGYASDNAGNADAGAGPSATFNVLSTDATLSNLVFSIGLNPVFSPGKFSYIRNVGFGTNTVIVTPTSNNPGATITINGTTAASGTASGPISLNVGPNTINVMVTAQDGATTQTYTVTVSRAGNNNDNLSSLKMSKGIFSPTFASGTTSYTDAVGNTITSITITPTAADPNASVKVNGATVSSGTASGAINLNVGNNTVNVMVTAQNGTTTQTYTVNVVRAGTSNDNLTSLKMSKGVFSPTFATATTAYADAVGNAIRLVTVTPTTSDTGATVTVNGTVVPSGTVSGAISLAVGANTINVVVTASDKVTTKTYTVTVTRAANSNDNLTSLKMSKGIFSPSFASATTSYADAVGNTISSVMVTPTASDADATIQVNGTTVPSGTASAAINLAVGANTINVVATASDKVTTKTYTVIVTRAGNNNDNLTSLKMSKGIFSPTFASATTAYADAVGNTITSVTVTPTASDTGATIKVNGTMVPSGTAYSVMNLAVGSSPVNVEVTASDGTTTKTYAITVTRAPGNADSYVPIAIGTGISVTKPTETPALAEDGIQVHQGISPNGDGINDFLQIDNISQYPDNKLSIMNRNGQLVYEASGYDNSSKVFDGHSNKNGQMQLPGTYFYQLDYTVKGATRHKTGFIMLKY